MDNLLTLLVLFISCLVTYCRVGTCCNYRGLFSILWLNKKPYVALPCWFHPRLIYLCTYTTKTTYSGKHWLIWKIDGQLPKLSPTNLHIQYPWSICGPLTKVFPPNKSAHMVCCLFQHYAYTFDRPIFDLFLSTKYYLNFLYKLQNNKSIFWQQNIKFIFVQVANYRVNFWQHNIKSGSELQNIKLFFVQVAKYELIFNNKYIKIINWILTTSLVAEKGMPLMRPLNSYS